MDSNLKSVVHTPTKAVDGTEVKMRPERPKFQTSVSRSSIDDNPIFMIYSTAPPIERNAGDGKKVKDVIWNMPTDNAFKQFWWIYTWPIRVMLMFTVPNPRMHRRVYPLTFVMCVLWIGVISYVIVELLDAIGMIDGISSFFLIAFSHSLYSQLRSIYSFSPLV